MRVILSAGKKVYFTLLASSIRRTVKPSDIPKLPIPEIA